MKLTDKKQSKATNSQTIELTPVFSLNYAREVPEELSQCVGAPQADIPGREGAAAGDF